MKLLPKVEISSTLLLNLKNSFLFFLPSILTLCINLFTTPIFARNLSHYDFSIMGYFNAINAVFLPFFNLSLFPYYMKGFHERTNDENMRVISNIIIFLAAVNLITILVGTILVYLFFSFTNVSFPLFPYILLSFFSSYFTTFIGSLTMNYKMKKQGVKFALISSVYPLISISLGLFFVVALQWGAKGRMGAILIGQGVVGILSFLLLYKKTPLDFSIIKKALKLGYPLIIMALIEIPILSLDRILLERQNDIVHFGLYNIGLSFAGYLLIMGTSLFQAFEPDFYKFIGLRKLKKLSLTAILVFGLIAFANIVFTIFSKPAIFFLTSGRYGVAYKFANIFVWSNMFLLLSYLLAIFFVSAEKTRSLLYIKITMAVFGVGVFSFAISRWGFMGAAYARVVINSFLCLFLLLSGLYIFLRRVRIGVIAF